MIKPGKTSVLGKSWRQSCKHSTHLDIQPTQHLDNKRLKAKCSTNIFGNSLRSSLCLLYLPTRNSTLNYLSLFPAVGGWRVISMPSTPQPALKLPSEGVTDHPQHGQKYVNTSLPPAQLCQEHQEGGGINKTTQVFAWLWSTKTHPNKTKQLWAMICFVRTALLLQTENKTPWNGCAMIYLSM